MKADEASAKQRARWTYPNQQALSTDDADQGIRGLGPADINVVFQPIVDLSTGAIFAVESLVRCKVPGLEAPPVLFGRAEQEHACGPLGRLIREVAFERCQDRALFVNIHPEELSAHWLVRPDDPLAFHDRDVYLEITEVAAFTHFELCMSVLREVCVRTGAHLVVDDFGAGYSNLERVLDLNPSIVKLDIALIKGIERHHRKQVLVRHLVDLCVDLGARVVAEGIEHIAELETLAELGVHYGQGYYLARPAYPVPEVQWEPAPRSARAASPWAATAPPPRPVVRPSRPPPSVRPRAPSRPPRGGSMRRDARTLGHVSLKRGLVKKGR